MQLLPISYPRSDEWELELRCLRAELVAARRHAAASTAASAAALLLACCALVTSMPRGQLQSWYLVRETPPLKHLEPDQHYVDLQELAIYQARPPL